MAERRSLRVSPTSSLSALPPWPLSPQLPLVHLVEPAVAVLPVDAVVDPELVDVEQEETQVAQLQVDPVAVQEVSRVVHPPLTQVAAIPSRAPAIAAPQLVVTPLVVLRVVTPLVVTPLTLVARATALTPAVIPRRTLNSPVLISASELIPPSSQLHFKEV